MTAYYNEIDPDAVAALRELIARDIIAPGHVDSRSIKDVTANDLKGFTQVHLFAGGGVWSVAARMAGWSDRRPLWTASCPCQPFSVAGKRGGEDDPRHLWPDVYRLVRTGRDAGLRLPIIVGEQVAGKAGDAWFDGVHTDLAREKIASRVINIPACAVDAPHERSRNYWAAMADADEFEGRGGSAGAGGEQRVEPSDGDVADAEGERGGRDEPERRSQGRAFDGRSHARSGEGDVGHPEREGWQGLDRYVDAGGGYGRGPDSDSGAGEAPATPRPATTPDDCDGGRALVDPARERRGEGRAETGVFGGRSAAAGADVLEQQYRPNGSWWADAGWIVCHDGKARRAKPGIPMLVTGLVGRVAAWSLIGNAINAILAAEVLGAILDAEKEITR